MTATVSIMQCAGGFGAQAGDCAVVLVHQGPRVMKACLVDLGSTSVGGLDGGQPMMAMRFIDDGWDFSEAERFVVITHAHTDQIGDASPEVAARFAKFRDATVFAGTPIREVNRGRLRTVLERLQPTRVRMLPDASPLRRGEEGALVDVFRHPVSGELTVAMKLLVPSPASVNEGTDENAASLGVWLTVEDRSGQPVVSFLSLGDMSPSDRSVRRLLDRIPGPVNLLKFPHHMSDEHDFEEFQRLVGDPTVVVSSGYSGGALSPLALLSQSAPPQAVVMAVADKGQRELETATATRARWQTYADHAGARFVYTKSVIATIDCDELAVTGAVLRGPTWPDLDPGRASPWAQADSIDIDLLAARP